MRKNGLALIAVIILIVFVAIAIVGVTSFTVQRLVGYNIEQRLSRCIYNAYAGLHYAIYQYRNSSTFFSGTVNIDADNNFTVSTVQGGAGLVIDATASDVAGQGKRYLLGVILKNTSLTDAVTIDRMIVTWTNSRNLTQIVIAGSTVFSGSASPSPQNINITDYTINANTSVALTHILWSGNMQNTTITLQCVMTDGSTTAVCTVYPSPAQPCGSGGLTIRSMGKTAGSDLYRSVEASYDTNTGKVTAFSQINATVP